MKLSDKLLTQFTNRYQRENNQGAIMLRDDEQQEDFDYEAAELETGDFENAPPVSQALAVREPQQVERAQQVILRTPEDYAMVLMPAISMESVQQRGQMLAELMSTLLVEGKDYGNIPGTQGNCLLLAGSEKLATFFGLSINMCMQDSIIERHPQPFVMYRYKATASRNGVTIAECEGICNSDEDCFKVWLDSPAPSDKAEQQAMIAAKTGRWSGYGDAPKKWQLRMPPPNVMGMLNNLSKRAQKRAYVGVVEKATGASQAYSAGLLKPGGGSSYRAPARTQPQAAASDRTPTAVKRITAEADSTTFWQHVKAARFEEAEAQAIVKQVLAGKFGWAEAVGKLPPL